MGWYEDDEMVRQWEETSKEEEKIAKRKVEGKSLLVEGVQRAPELLVSQVSTKEKVQQRKKSCEGLVQLEDGGERKQAGVQRHGRNGAESQKTISKMGSRLLGENLFTVQEGLRFAVKERHAGEHNRNRGDEAGHGRCDKESQSKRRN